jgi:predicted permease
MKRKAQLYLIVVSLAGLAIFFILEAGNRLTPPVAPGGTAVPAQVAHAAPAGTGFLSAATASLWQNGTSPLSRLLLQVFIIISAAGIAGRIAKRIGQPAVVGEMVAGILLGPSLFGLIAPAAFQFVFPTSSFEPLRLFSQIGVCLFMFAVGMELDVLQLKQKVPTAIVVSHSSIVIPYLLGVGLAYFLYEQLAQPGASFIAFALFMGISMSITAFPVLVRILKDRGIFKTQLGSTATACAAVDRRYGLDYSRLCRRHRTRHQRWRRRYHLLVGGGFRMSDVICYSPHAAELDGAGNRLSAKNQALAS